MDKELKVLKNCKKDFIYERNGYLFAVLEKGASSKLIVLDLNQPNELREIVEIEPFYCSRNYSADYTEFLMKSQRYLLDRNKYFSKIQR